MAKEPLISIVGGGMSAIYAYWGCIDAGYDPRDVEVIVSSFSKMPGAIFMYESPIAWPKIEVNSILLGSSRGYAFKQWGEESAKTSAAQRFLLSNWVQESLYNSDELLPILWGMIPKIVKREPLTPEELFELKVNRKAVICTFANLTIKLEYAKQNFLKSNTIFTALYSASNYVVIYNGLPDVPWVRQTITPSITHVEYNGVANSESIRRYEEARGFPVGHINVVPDLAPNCPPLPLDSRREGNLLRVGRFAVFEPGYLSHRARHDVNNFLRTL